jgi:hypothetical protein
MALQAVFDQIAAIQKGTQPAKGAPDMGGNRVRRIAAPVDDDDAVNLKHLNTELTALEKKLTKKNVQNLTGKLREPQVPQLRDLAVGPLPDSTTAQDGEMLRRQGALQFFDGATRTWKLVAPRSFIRNIPTDPLPDEATATDGEMIYWQGALMLFDGTTQTWVAV